MSASWPDYIVCDCGRKVDTPSQWISVKDRLPDEYTPVLVQKAKRVFCAQLLSSVNGYWWESVDSEIFLGNFEGTTHWMPLPDATVVR